MKASLVCIILYCTCFLSLSALEAGAFADTLSEPVSAAARLRSCGVAVPGCDAGVQFAVKTNMLYDAALIPNLGVELGFARHYSASVSWMHAWWSKNVLHRYWRVYGGEVELRRWWPSCGSRLSGHHLGIYGQMLTYDLEFGNRGYQGGRWSYAAGLSYGYSLAVSRHFNIDFTIGIGYLWGRYKKYHYEDGCYVWDSTRNRRWLGPTKAEISLVYLIGGKNVRKGGGR